MTDYLLLLGSNLGDREAYLRTAVQMLSQRTSHLRESAIYETAAWGVEDQQGFLNQAVMISTEMEPSELLAFAKNLETEIGRCHRQRWHEREIDIDILLWSGGRYSSDDLMIPHRHLPERAFALVPAVEIAAHWPADEYGSTVLDLLEKTEDQLEVHIFKI